MSAVTTAYLANARPLKPERLKHWQRRSVSASVTRLYGWLSGLSRHSATIAGHRVVWLEAGNPGGEIVVLLHGFGASKENWVPLLPFLSRRYRVLLPDLPGWGDSQFRTDARYGLDDQVERVSAWLRLRTGRPTHLVGNSMGGSIAGLLAARHPHQIASLTLMNASGVTGDGHTPFEAGLLKGRNHLVAHNLRGVFRLLRLAVSSQALAAALTPSVYLDLVSRRHVNEHLFRHLLQYPPSPEQATFSDITAPTLVLWGRNDRMLHASCANTFKRLIPHSHLVILEKVGHLPMIESPKVTARLMRKLWSQRL